MLHYTITFEQLAEHNMLGGDLAFALSKRIQLNNREMNILKTKVQGSLSCNHNSQCGLKTQIIYSKHDKNIQF